MWSWDHHHLDWKKLGRRSQLSQVSNTKGNLFFFLFIFCFLLLLHEVRNWNCKIMCIEKRTYTYFVLSQRLFMQQTKPVLALSCKFPEPSDKRGQKVSLKHQEKTLYRRQYRYLPIKPRNVRENILEHWTWLNIWQLWFFCCNYYNNTWMQKSFNVIKRILPGFLKRLFLNVCFKNCLLQSEN